jgi:hypothetical protein
MMIPRDSLSLDNQEKGRKGEGKCKYDKKANPPTPLTDIEETWDVRLLFMLHVLLVYMM